MKKVIAYLQGGLGNRCFVYAMARALSLCAGAGLQFDLRAFKLDKVYRRKLSLSAFNCALDNAVDPPVAICKIWNVFRLKCPQLLRQCGNYINERDADIESALANFHGTIRLDGYWQSEKYFYDYRDQIVADFKLKDDSWLQDDVSALAIRNDPESAFVHVRSYKDIPGRADGSGAIGVDYYAAAISKLKVLVPAVEKMFLFSDDLPWALERIVPVATAHRVTCVPVGLDAPSSQIRDFTLMRLCKHGIVANSSYSWWAGWLGEQEWLSRGVSPLRFFPSGGSNKSFWPKRWNVVSM